MASRKVLLELRGDVAIVTLNDPESLNAISLPLLEDLDEAIMEAAGRARAMMLTGAGRGFCSGAGLKGVLDAGGGAPDFGRELETHLNPVMRRLRALPIPWISAVRGPAVGAGCALALAGDLIVASDTAYFVQAFARVGLVPDGGSTHLLTRGTTRVRAMEMMLLAEKTLAAQAVQWGLINRVVPDNQLDSVAMELAARLAAGPTRSYALIREAAWRALDSGWEEVLRLERQNQSLACATQDAVEGIAAFVEKRPAQFMGR
ncbi:enoyl-CoA hydratase-related protein [Phenylobacterium sp. LjRoot225]|uniref:enoyl-CoA hydratase-related protein n=1 Tax=Phenylobacterium sp. LjRoot225 TaxID=3342285 RepID=UPI003ECD01E5